MHFVGESFWGMHFFWWLFWVVVIMLLFSPITPISTGRRRQTPLEVLQRRYAAGEVSTAEYEERKTKLDRDTKPVK
jgi:putative membrane protein